MNKLLEAAEAAIESRGPAPDLAWVHARAVQRRRRRAAAVGVVSSVLVLALGVAGLRMLLARDASQQLVTIDPTHRTSDSRGGRSGGDDDRPGRRRGQEPLVATTDTAPSSVPLEDGNDPTESSMSSASTVVPEGDAAPTSTTVGAGGDSSALYRPRPDCPDGSVVPVGQASDAVNFEPLGSIWCFDLSPAAPATAVQGSNSWVDDFTVDSFMHRFADGDMGYRVFDGAGDAPGRSQHFVNQNHWMVDARGGFTGGASIRPDRAFRFADGKLIVEADFAAAIPEYGGNAWGELTITSAPAPTGVTADNLYAYGQFGGHWTVGCRLQSGRTPTCAVLGPNPDSAPANGQCSAIPGGYRVSELSFFQRCGGDVMGGYPSGDTGPWRECERDGMDMACRDRFRMEITKDSLTLYVNGVKYFEDAGWPASHQLPDSFVNGDVYVYQSSWQWRVDADTTIRYHWDHFAVNPSTGPNPSEWYR